MPQVLAPELRSKLDSAPKTPGCYLFRDWAGHIIYVGKSKVLRNRVRSYFGAAAEQDERIEKLIREIRDVDFLTTPTELEALIQEYRLIKQYKPWFNAQHKRDTVHPFLRIDCQEEYPGITLADAHAGDGAMYFGAFRDSYDAREAIALLYEVWGTPLCERASFRAATRPCLNHGMRKCLGPCARAVEPATYREAIRDIVRILSGEPTSATARLEAQMRQHAAAMDFEKANDVKLLSQRLERLRRKCACLFRITEDMNAIVLLRGYGEEALSAFLILGGKALCRADLRDAKDTEAIERFADQWARGEAVLAQEPWLISCLEEIFADKMLLRLPDGFGKQEVMRLMMDGLGAYADAPAKRRGSGKVRED